MVLSATLIALGLALLIASIRNTYKQTWAYMRQPGSASQAGDMPQSSGPGSMPQGQLGGQAQA